MTNLSLKQKIIGLIALIGTILIIIFQRGIYSNSTPQSQTTNNQEIEVVSTSPSPLEEAVVLPNQEIKITFNYPIQNSGEFKVKMDPAAEYKITLSEDRKTAQINFSKPLKLGGGYTIFIQPDTKFDGKGNLNKDINFHIKTINYSGV